MQTGRTTFRNVRLPCSEHRTLVNRLIIAALIAAAAATTGCAGPDLVMANPVTSGTVPQNHVVKKHGYAESQNGLPPGSMSDEAIIEQADKTQICTKVVLKELSAIDLSAAEIKVTTSSGALLQPTLTAEPPTSHSFEGLVPHREQTGTHTTCKGEGDSVVCNTEPVYTTSMIRGQVDVFESRGRLCAANKGLLTTDTKDLTLKISTPTARPGAWGVGHGSKSVTFRWAFQ